MSAIPKGELAFAGGSSVGTFLPIIAWALGFRDFHFFGMDGCFSGNSTHAAHHPRCDDPDEFVFNGETFITTSCLLKSAFELFNVLAAMPDANVTFHGEGLIQSMAKAKPIAKPPDHPLAIQIT